MTSEDERRILRNLTSPESCLLAEASCTIHQIKCGPTPDHGPYRHEDLARGLIGVLRVLGHTVTAAGKQPRLGPNPDLIDRDGDRWWEVVPGGYSMDVYRNQVPTGKANHKPIPRSTIELTSGPLIEVPRCLDRGPVRVAGPVQA